MVKGRSSRAIFSHIKIARARVGVVRIYWTRKAFWWWSPWSLMIHIFLPGAICFLQQLRKYMLKTIGFFLFSFCPHMPFVGMEAWMWLQRYGFLWNQWWDQITTCPWSTPTWVLVLSWQITSGCTSYALHQESFMSVANFFELEGLELPSGIRHQKRYLARTKKVRYPEVLVLTLLRSYGHHKTWTSL